MDTPNCLEARLRAVAVSLTELAHQVLAMPTADPYGVLEALQDVPATLDGLISGLVALEDTASIAVDAALMADASDAQVHAALEDWGQAD